MCAVCWRWMGADGRLSAVSAFSLSSSLASWMTSTESVVLPTPGPADGDGEMRRWEDREMGTGDEQVAGEG